MEEEGEVFLYSSAMFKAAIKVSKEGSCEEAESNCNVSMGSGEAEEVMLLRRREKTEDAKDAIWKICPVAGKEERDYGGLLRMRQAWPVWLFAP